MKKIFIAAAQAAGEPLPELVEEIRSLEKLLRPLDQREIHKLESNRAANAADIFDTFSREQNAITVFHYAGHADQRELHFEDGGHARGIAELFGLTQSKNLRLVFLNGCATLGHVDRLHEAGVAAVVATNSRIQDQVARDFATFFYKYWAIPGNTLEQAFQMATAWVHNKPGEQHRDIAIETRSVGRAAAEREDISPWRLWLNPQLDEAEKQILRNWQLHPPVVLAPQILEKVETVTSSSLRKIATEFCDTDADARKMVEQERCSELMALIIRLPWTVGTHLRRLFAVDKDKTMMQNGAARLCELAEGYTELTRFVCYTALSALWEDALHHGHELELDIPSILPDASVPLPPDYIFHLKQYHRMLLEIPGDAIGLEAKMGVFLNEVNGRLQTAYQFMEGLKDATAQRGQPELLAHFVAHNGPKGGLDEVCRKAEAAFAQFIRAAFFLTEYTLYSVRAISVDKVRYLNLELPFVHKSIALHAAFGEIKTLPTKRKVAGDNYSMLLAPRAGAGEDPLENALNLSPFYIDKHALISDKRDNAPAVFVLKNQTTSYPEMGDSMEKAYAYEYLDRDVNHQYLSPEDHHLNIAQDGLQVSESAPLQLKTEDNQRFREIYKQLDKFNQDFHFAL